MASIEFWGLFRDWKIHGEDRDKLLHNDSCWDSVTLSTNNPLITLRLDWPAAKVLLQVSWPPQLLPFFRRHYSGWLEWLSPGSSGRLWRERRIWSWVGEGWWWRFGSCDAQDAKASLLWLIACLVPKYKTVFSNLMRTCRDKCLILQKKYELIMNDSKFWRLSSTHKCIGVPTFCSESLIRCHPHY